MVQRSLEVAEHINLLRVVDCAVCNLDDGFLAACLGVFPVGELIARVRLLDMAIPTCRLLEVAEHINFFGVVDGVVRSLDDGFLAACLGVFPVLGFACWTWLFHLAGCYNAYSRLLNAIASWLSSVVPSILGSRYI